MINPLDLLTIGHAYLDSPSATEYLRTVGTVIPTHCSGKAEDRRDRENMYYRNANMRVCPRLTFSRLINNIFPSSITQVDSSSLTSCGKSPARIGEWPFSPQLRCFLVIVTITSLGLTEKFTFNGTLSCKCRKYNISSIHSSIDRSHVAATKFESSRQKLRNPTSYRKQRIFINKL